MIKIVRSLALVLILGLGVSVASSVLCVDDALADRKGWSNPDD